MSGFIKGSIKLTRLQLKRREMLDLTHVQEEDHYHHCDGEHEGNLVVEDKEAGAT